MQNPQQPKIVHKLLVRTFILLVSVAVVFLGIQKVLDWRTDSGSGSANSDGMIAAVEILDQGQQAVIFDKDGKKIPCPDYAEGKTDRDVVWQPDGNAVFFTSDRRETAYNLFRWNPESGNVVMKSSGSISRFDPSFAVPDDTTNAGQVAEAGQFALIVQGGFVLDFNIKESSSQQILPPPGGVTVGSEDGAGQSGQFDQVYQHFGNSFRMARWGLDKAFLAAIMKRDEGEILILQNANPKTDQEKIPIPLITGEHVDFDIAPKNGIVVFALQEFLFMDPEHPDERFVKNGKAVKPYHHGLFAYDPAKNARFAIISSPDDKTCFGSPVVSADGSEVAFTMGEWDGTDYRPKRLLVAPLNEHAAEAITPMIEGEIYEISWSPDGTKLLYIRKEQGGKRAVYMLDRKTGEKKISSDGDYIRPRFSPQTK